MNVARPRILLIGDTLNAGGTEGQFVEIACRLDRSRWEVQVACLLAEGPLRGRLECAGVRVWNCGPGSLKSPRVVAVVWQLARYLRAHKIHLVHSFDFYSNVLAIPAARLAGIPAVIASQRDLGNLRPRLQQRIHQMVLRLARHLLVNSEAVAERMKLDRIAEPARIVVVPNGVDVTRFSQVPGSRRSPSGPVIVGTLANLRPEKGLADFVQSAALVRDHCPNVHFLIWGDGPLRPDLERLIHRLRLNGVVELCGTTTEPELALRKLDIFVLPSISEACSNALLEAMATGVAVVATRVGGNPFLVKEEQTGLLVPPRDPAALAKAIIRLIDDPVLAAELADRGRDRVRAKHSIDQLLARIEALYERALAGEDK